MEWNRRFHIPISGLVLVLLLGACSKAPEAEKASASERLEVQMASLEEEIDVLVGEARCTEDASCEAVAFGEKPCGGPWAYVIFSTEETDAEELKQAVEKYNETEDKYNETNPGLVSDCAFVLPPESLKCVEQTCSELN